MEEIPVKRKFLLNTSQYEQHGGEFIALERGGRGKIIASGNSYKKVVDAAKKVAVSFLIVAVPKKAAVRTR